MSLQLRLKAVAEKVPPSLGKYLSYVPFSIRLGPSYWSTVNTIRDWQNRPDTTSDIYIKKLQSLLTYAYENIGFYQQFYESKNFSPKDMSSIEDWASVPIVTKTDLQCFPLRSRCASATKGMNINTGGTSGQPLEFRIDSRAFAREWAHMHYIWKAHGYHPQHLKLSFRGKNFNTNDALRYNSVHNEYVVNASAPMYRVVATVMELSRSCAIRWCHGYPSLISEFAREIEKNAPSAYPKFRANLIGVLLGSEYPAPTYRQVIERVLTSHVVSWYGHSEMAVLAPETARGIYQSLPTYGYAEAVRTSDGKSKRLICTSLYNKAHPFIRYDTGDLVEEVSNRDYSLSFRIHEGRVGDFIKDRQGNSHSLTAIVFGRHHEAFSMLNHVQVRDQGGGIITFVMTPQDSSVDIAVLKRGFNLENLDIEFQFEVVDAPVRTKEGKIRLKL